MSRLEEQTVFRLPEGTSKRAENLIPALSDDPKFFGIGKVSKSMVLRLALLEGLEKMEKRYKSKIKTKR